jgi:hypothetical protein
VKTIQRIGSKERPGEFNVLALLEDGDHQPVQGDDVVLEGLGGCRVLQSRPNTYGLPGAEAHHQVVILDVLRTDTGPDVGDQSYSMSVLTGGPSPAPTSPPAPASDAPATETSDAAMDLVWTGLEHGIESVRGGGPLVPFVMVETAGERKLSRFLVGSPDRMDLEGSVQQAVAFASTAAAGSPDRLVLVYDAYLRMGDERFDAIYAEGIEGGSVAVVLAQRYRPKGRFRGFETIGNAQALPPTMGHLGAAG